MAFGFAKAVDLEPGMRFRRARGQGDMTFAWLEPVQSRFDGRRRVAVVTESGFRFVCEWDTRMLLVEFDQP